MPPSPHSVNTCHRGLRQGQRDRPDQLKLLRDIISVSLGTSSPAAMCTGVALESHGNREILCVYACEQACECVCVCVSASFSLWDQVSSRSSSAVAWRVVAAKRLSSASFHVLFLLSSLFPSLPFFPSLLYLRGEECCIKSNKQVYSCKCNDPSPPHDLVNRVPSSCAL